MLGARYPPHYPAAAAAAPNQLHFANLNAADVDAISARNARRPLQCLGENDAKFRTTRRAFNVCDDSAIIGKTHNDPVALFMAATAALVTFGDTRRFAWHCDA